MGLGSASVKFVCAAKSAGVDFSRTLMIGRQSLTTDPESLKKVFATLGIAEDPENFLRDNQFGEAFFSLVGARDVDSLDTSSYENATVLHDMNLPISEELRGRYSVVYDGGTLEHVFNIPQAMKNCMEMVRVGGHFLQVGGANNFMGHGFWQFSPELLFRVFSVENGYQVEAMFLHEILLDWKCKDDVWYGVSDPDKVRTRVELCNSFRTFIVTIARRVSDAEIFLTPPQQSDYVAVWDQHAKEKNNVTAPSHSSASRIQQAMDRLPPQRSWRSCVPEPVKRVLRPLLGRGSRPFDRQYFKRIHENDFLRGNFS